MKRRLIGMRFCAIAAAAVAIGTAGEARARTMLPLDLRALTARADGLLYGVAEWSVAKVKDDDVDIFREVTVRVQRSYKGAAKEGEAVVVRREGGTVGGVGMKVFGAASFQVGEEVVVFVEQRGAASYVVGMSQGKLRVATQADGSKLVMAP